MEGLSGAGKSSVYEELIQRGFRAISTDRAWKGRTGPDGSIWNWQRAVAELESQEPEVLFVCGSSRNRDSFLPYFTKVFNLRIDDDTMRRRLRERTNNDFGKQPEELALMLSLNRSSESPAGAIDVDATQPLQRVVDELLLSADCGMTSDSTPVPWSKRGSARGESFVIPESAAVLRGTPDRFWDVLGRETITRLEFGWSGRVLAALLSYLDEQGIDLIHSDHDEFASALFQSHAGSVFVLTAEHRERYLARLDPADFDGAALRRYYEKLNETPADGVGYAMLDGIAFLRDTLEPLEAVIVAVLIIQEYRIGSPTGSNPSRS